MNLFSLLKRPIAYAPLALSLAAILTIVTHIAVSGSAPQPDEGTAAHIWQLLMLVQLPIVALFAIRWLPEAPRPALMIVTLQVAAMAAALAPVALLKW
ncbi:MAG TPA: hypothetical protein VEI06_10775 [Gemmatimonadaceae bacterium]|nr:hypothetical protein [Gemmatimonadaceae bacterium]